MVHLVHWLKPYFSASVLSVQHTWIADITKIAYTNDLYRVTGDRW